MDHRVPVVVTTPGRVRVRRTRTYVRKSDPTKGREYHRPEGRIWTVVRPEEPNSNLHLHPLQTPSLCPLPSAAQGPGS